jgi:hypothetical protein
MKTPSTILAGLALRGQEIVFPTFPVSQSTSRQEEDVRLKFILIAMAFIAAGIIGSTTAVLADTPVTPAEAEKIKVALEGRNCSGGKMEKETEGGVVVYEVDDAKCRDGVYEIQLDKGFKVIEISRD